MVNREFEFATRYLANITSSGPKANLAGFRRELSESIKDGAAATQKITAWVDLSSKQ